MIDSTVIIPPSFRSSYGYFRASPLALSCLRPALTPFAFASLLRIGPPESFLPDASVATGGGNCLPYGPHRRRLHTEDRTLLARSRFRFGGRFQQELRIKSVTRGERWVEAGGGQQAQVAPRCSREENGNRRLRRDGKISSFPVGRRRRRRWRRGRDGCRAGPSRVW